MNKIVSFLFLQHLYLGIVIMVIIPHNQCPDVRVVAAWACDAQSVAASKYLTLCIFYPGGVCLVAGPHPPCPWRWPARGPAPANPCKPTPAPRISSSPSPSTTTTSSSLEAGLAAPPSQPSVQHELQPALTRTPHVTMTKIDIKDSEGGGGGGQRASSSKSPSPARREAGVQNTKEAAKEADGNGAKHEAAMDQSKNSDKNREGVSNESGYFEDDEESSSLQQEDSIEIIFDKNASNNNSGQSSSQTGRTSINIRPHYIGHYVLWATA